MAQIVFADDDQNNRFVIGMHLRLLGHQVREAGTGREALELVAESRPEVLLLDLMMPDLDGYEACAALRADPATADLPILLLTALDYKEEQARQQGAWFDAVVLKPFRVEALQRSIDQLLASVPAA